MQAIQQPAPAMQPSDNSQTATGLLQPILRLAIGSAASVLSDHSCGRSGDNEGTVGEEQRVPDIRETTARLVSFDEGDKKVPPNEATTGMAVKCETAGIGISKTPPTTPCALSASASGHHVRRKPLGASYMLYSYFFSSEATKLFAPKGKETPEEALDKMIALLGKAINDRQFGADFGKIVEGRPEYRRLDRNDIDKIVRKACHVHMALTIAKRVISACEPFSFKRCCQEASDSLMRSFPMDDSVKGTTVARWYRGFRRSRSFSLPIARKQKLVVDRGITDFFRRNADMNAAFMHFMTRYIRAGIDVGSAALLGYGYFVDTLLPLAAKEHGYNAATGLHFFLAQYGLHEIQLSAFEFWYRDHIAPFHLEVSAKEERRQLGMGLFPPLVPQPTRHSHSYHEAPRNYSFQYPHMYYHQHHGM